MTEQKGRNYSFYEKMYGIPEGTVNWYHCGNCYCRIRVNTLEAAYAVQKIASKETANGGWFHGMQLGSIQAMEQPDGSFHYELMC